MALDRWDPFRELRRMEDTVDRLWRGLGPHAGGPSSDVDSWGIPLDLAREGDDIVVRASLPGVKPGNINVTIEENVLTISGNTEEESEVAKGTYLLRERRTGAFQRSIRLPETIDPDNAETTYEAGLLTVTLPRLESTKVKQLTVNVKEDRALAGKN